MEIDEAQRTERRALVNARDVSAASVNALIAKIRAYIKTWNAQAKPFVWTATTDEILAKVRLVQTNIRQLVDNNAK